LRGGFDINIMVENSHLTFDGTGSEINNHLLRWYNLKKSYNLRRPFFELNYEEFENRLDSLQMDFNLIQESVNNLENKNLMDDVFTAYSQVMKLNYLLVHYNLYDQSIEIPPLLKEAIASQAALNYLADIGLADYFISLHLYYDAHLGPKVWKQELNGNDSLINQYHVLLYDKVGELVPQENLLEFFKAKTVLSELQSKGLYNQFESLNQQFQVEFPSSKYSCQNFPYSAGLESDVLNQRKRIYHLALCVLLRLCQLRNEQVLASSIYHF
jgi:hypothetical protein